MASSSQAPTVSEDSFPSVTCLHNLQVPQLSCGVLSMQGKWDIQVSPAVSAVPGPIWSLPWRPSYLGPVSFPGFHPHDCLHRCSTCYVHSATIKLSAIGYKDLFELVLFDIYLSNHSCQCVCASDLRTTCELAPSFHYVCPQELK